MGLDAGRLELVFRQLLDNGRYFEAPRWHRGRLWLVDAGARTLIRMTEDGSPDIVCSLEGVPAGLGFLAGGDAVVTDMHGRSLVRCADGRPTQYADLSYIAGTLDDMTIDGNGHTYVGDLGFDLKSGIKDGPFGRLVLVGPTREPRVVAEGLNFPNGIAISGDGRRLVVAETNGGCLACYTVRPDGMLQFDRRIGSFKAPDGICLDRDGAVWVSVLDESCFVRIAADGQILDRIPVPGRRAVACVLGGEDRRTLFCISMDTAPTALAGTKPRSFLDATVVEVPGEGYP